MKRASGYGRKWLPQPVSGKKRAAEDEPISSSYPPVNTIKTYRPPNKYRLSLDDFRSTEGPRLSPRTSRPLVQSARTKLLEAQTALRDDFDRACAQSLQSRFNLAAVPGGDDHHLVRIEILLGDAQHIV
jgi:hypothetical protein